MGAKVRKSKKMPAARYSYLKPNMISHVLVLGIYASLMRNLVLAPVLIRTRPPYLLEEQKASN